MSWPLQDNDRGDVDRPRGRSSNKDTEADETDNRSGGHKRQRQESLVSHEQPVAAVHHGAAKTSDKAANDAAQATSASDTDSSDVSQCDTFLPLHADNDEEKNNSVEASGVDSGTSSVTARIHGRYYQLSLVSVPIQCTISGPGICEPPLIAALAVAADTSDTPSLVARASLLPDSTRIEYATEPTLQGQTTVRGQVLGDVQGVETLFFVFSDLKVTRPGSWTLQVEILTPSTTTTTTNLRDPVMARIVSSSRTLAVPETSPLTVGPVQVDVQTMELLETLSDQGVSFKGRT